MLRAFLFVATLVTASASLQSQWAVFKHKYDKQYSGAEEASRRDIYQANLKLIAEHNERFAKGETRFYLGENRFADMTAAEFAAKMNTLRLHVAAPEHVREVKVSDLPDTVDWRDQGYVTAVKDQGECSSCWAFSATGAIEGQHFAATGELVSLSESNLVDCSRAQGNHACDGGYPFWAFDYVIANKGIDTEASYPYQDKESTCEFDISTVGATISSYVNLTVGSESKLQQATANVGPISVAIDADNYSFQLYSGGVYDEPHCSPEYLTHAVLVVGYGTDQGLDYWLVKNSWGSSWGLQGYIEMSRNKDNQCGIATMAIYPNI